MRTPARCSVSSTHPRRKRRPRYTARRTGWSRTTSMRFRRGCEAASCPRCDPLSSGAVKRQTVRMPLVERENQLAALRQYAHEAAAGEGRVVLVTAEAGGGKSVLLERLQSELAEARWAWGTCDGLTTPQPLAPLADLAHDLGGPVRELYRECTDRELLFRALLDQVSETAGLDVVVVEDIHWADEATLDLLRFLSRRIRT